MSMNPHKVSLFWLQNERTLKHLEVQLPIILEIQNINK